MAYETRGHVVVRLLDSDATTQLSEVALEISMFDGVWPVVAALEGGGFVVSWSDWDGDSSGIAAQMFDASGAPIGDAWTVNTATMGQQSDPVITGLPGGGFVIVWFSFYDEDLDEPRCSLRAQIYDPDGALLRKSAERRRSPFPGQTYPTASVTGMPSAV